MYLIALLALSTGMRRGELIALTWDNVDFVNKQIHVRANTVNGLNGKTITKDPKTAAGNRDIIIGDDVINELKKARKEYIEDRNTWGTGFNDGGFVIRQRRGDPYKPDSLTQKWNRFVESNNLPKIRLHDTRHTNATALIESGVNAKVVQHRLGHSDISVTLNTYTHVLPSMDEEAAKMIDDILKIAN